MRLLSTNIDNGKRLIVEEFAGDQIPPYAILSHTWETEEVLLAHMHDGTATQKRGFNKIRYAASQASRDGYQYVWIDTCCIDKTSSAELSEAINSMYAYYQNATICYAYLADVPADVDTSSDDSEFTRSKWFTRGWTLQELLAPRDLVFFSGDWIPIGHKWTLYEIISKVTKINTEVLRGARQLDTISVAERMSWAAARKTSRLEDMAYCLMGIFSVNMPMLYGEGIKAFQRLQEEIMKYSDDQSIFAWVVPEMNSTKLHGLLADSPASFLHSGGMITYSDAESHTKFDMSNRGLHIDLPLTRYDEDIYAAALSCPALYGGYDGYLAIYLMKLPSGSDQYARIRCNKLGALDRKGQVLPIYVRQQIPVFNDINAVYPNHYFRIRVINDVQSAYTIPKVSVLSNSSSNNDDKINSTTTTGTSAAAATTATTIKQPNSVFATSAAADSNITLVQRRNYSTTNTTQVTSSSPPSSLPQPPQTTTIYQLPRNIPRQIRIPKRFNTLVSSIIFQRTTDSETFVLLMGCMTDFTIGFSILDLGNLRQIQREMQNQYNNQNNPTQNPNPKPSKKSNNKNQPDQEQQYPTLADFQNHFHPSPPSTPLVLEYHRVRVDVQPRVQGDSKYYYVDVNIESIPREGPIAAMLETVDVIVGDNPIRNRRKIWSKIGFS